VVLELLVERADALVPQQLHDVDERAVAGRLGDAHVEQPVAGERLPAFAALALHLVQRRLDRGDLRLLRRLRRERGALALDHVARAEQLERPRRGLVGGGHVACAAGREHVDARADPHLDEPLDLERDQRLAHRRPRHAELLREVALGGQPRAGRELAGLDEAPDLVRDLAVQAAGLDAVEGHGEAARRARRRGSGSVMRAARVVNWSDQLTAESRHACILV